MVVRKRPHDFSFAQDLDAILEAAKKNPLPLVKQDKQWLPTQEGLTMLSFKIEGFDQDEKGFVDYVSRLLQKILMLKLGDVLEGRLYALEGANTFIDMGPDDRALFLYRHPLNWLQTEHVPGDLPVDRHVREAEKSVLRVLDSGWVYFNEFIHGVVVPLSEQSILMLKKQGKQWKYTLPPTVKKSLPSSKQLY